MHTPQHEFVTTNRYRSQKTLKAAGIGSSLAATQRKVAWLLVTPATFLMFLLLLGPIFVVVILSFTDWQFGMDGFNFIGFANYTHLLEEGVFRRSFINTCIYTVVAVPCSIFLGLGVAILIEAGTSLNRFYRAAYFLPVMSCTVAMAVTWEFVLHPELGIASVVLPWFGLEGVELLQDERTVLLTLCGIGIWQNLGFNMVLFMAGLAGIPQELYEAGELDGIGSPWQKFSTITWPLLSPVTLFVTIMSMVRSFQVFDSVKVLTDGGPNNASEVLLYTMYMEAFEFFRTGYASAITVVFLVCVLIVVLLKTWWLDKHVHYA